MLATDYAKYYRIAPQQEGESDCHRAAQDAQFA